jgi:hypothetical protein
MSRLIIHVDSEQLKDEQLWEGLSAFLSNDDAFQLLKAIVRLMQSGDLGFWLSTRLMRELTTFAAGQQKVDEMLFLSWLEQGGSLELNVRWEIQSLPDNGGIYRTLLKGGKKDES